MYALRHVTSDHHSVPMLQGYERSTEVHTRAI